MQVFGKIAMLRIAGYASENISANGIICTIPEAYRPAVVWDRAGEIYNMDSNTPNGYISVDAIGNVVVSIAWSQNTWKFGHAMWMVGE